MRWKTSNIHLHLELTNLTTGELLGNADILIPASEIPDRISVEPPGFAKAMVERRELENLLASAMSWLLVQAVTDRGDGAVYSL